METLKIDPLLMKKDILSIIKQYYDYEHIDITEEKDDSFLIFLPTGCITYTEEEGLLISYDFEFLTSHFDVRINASIIEHIFKKGYDITVSEGYWTIVSEEGLVLDTIWEHDVWALLEENDQDMNNPELFYDALYTLKDKLLNKETIKLN